MAAANLSTMAFRKRLQFSRGQVTLWPASEHGPMLRPDIVGPFRADMKLYSCGPVHSIS